MEATTATQTPTTTIVENLTPLLIETLREGNTILIAPEPGTANMAAITVYSRKTGKTNKQVVPLDNHISCNKLAEIIKFCIKKISK